MALRDSRWLLHELFRTDVEEHARQLLKRREFSRFQIGSTNAQVMSQTQARKHAQLTDEQYAMIRRGDIKDGMVYSSLSFDQHELFLNLERRLKSGRTLSQSFSEAYQRLLTIVKSEQRTVKDQVRA